jgi:hypothetical protein
MIFYYYLQEMKEKEFLNNLSKDFGEFVEALSLDYCRLNGKDRLSWGHKLYFFNNGIVIGDPRKSCFNIYLKDVERAVVTDRGLSIHCKDDTLQETYHLELGTSLFDKKLRFQID